MDKIKCTCGASNFMAGRPAGMRPEAVVLHRSGGSADDIRARFLDGATATSAHYVVGKDGHITQYVEEKDTAFHAGLAINPTWKGLKAKVNPNFYTIGIELEGSADEPVPDEQSEGCAALVAEIAARCKIPIDEDHIVLHNEIRASRDCPGAVFARDAFVQRVLLAASSPAVFPAPGEVDILKNTNVREGLPSTSARVVSVLRGGSKARVSGYTLQGDEVNGNSTWFLSEDGNFFWAGNSSVPQPRPQTNHEEGDAVAPPSSGTAATEAMGATPLNLAPAARIGIDEIDRFFLSESCPPLDLAQSGRDAVGIIQDLLTGHGFPKLPSILSPAYGAFGDLTRRALGDFQNSYGMAPNAVLTSETMKQLVGLPARDPRATRAHFSLVLGLPFTGMHRILALTAQMEGVGKFAALNLNTDSAGLSFGLIQWAQRPGRLLEIVSAFRDSAPEKFAEIFGDGDAALTAKLITHLKKPSGGVAEKTGITTDSEFDLIASPWKERFAKAALHPEYQKLQVNTALQAFQASLARIRQYDVAAVVKSERAVAFMLDVANQFGDGLVKRPAQPPDRGLAGIYRRVLRPGMGEQDLLQAIADATVAAMAERFQAGVRARRSLFLTTPLLSSKDDQATLKAAGGGT